MYSSEGKSGGGAASISACERQLIGELESRHAKHVRLALMFSGRVQGVGFRWTNQSLAHERGLVGWAQNLPDGRVSMEIEGRADRIVDHLSALHAGYRHFGARVHLDSYEWLRTDDQATNFDIRF
ncbi:acylphosphatase [Collinsella sp. AGMB00827]|uniref:acylphosphatase n=2 Tax=Collinsella ureilytica TaxID=2869515 RepID=A0ABS7MIG0_9ACTN|nr:acylphosphatase [Collinsella urealyticum]